LARHNKTLQQMLKPGSDPDEGDEALRYYANHTAQIEVKNYSLEDWIWDKFASCAWYLASS